MRAARRLWVSLVTIGVFCVFSAIATNLAAVIFPHWIVYRKTSTDAYTNRGLFQICKESFGSECLEISNPLHPYHECVTASGTCDERQKSRAINISRLRITNWALHVIALGLETFTSFGCIFYLLAVRYCVSKPSAQCAQSCLAVSGYLLWLSGLITLLGIISFEGATIIETITTDIKINGLTERLPSAEGQTTEPNYGLSSHLSWASVFLGIAASWFWIVASFVQPPPHISVASMIALTSSSTVPLYPLAPKQKTQQQETQP